MPWSETSPMDQKTQFIADYLRATLSISGAVRSATASAARPATSGSIAIYRTGPGGLQERSRRPIKLAQSARPTHIVSKRSSELRTAPSRAGAPRSCCRSCAKRHPALGPCPRRTTVCDILKPPWAWCPRNAGGAAHRPPGQAHHDRILAPNERVVRRFQGPVQNRRRPLLLSRSPSPTATAATCSAATAC